MRHRVVYDGHRFLDEPASSRSAQADPQARGVDLEHSVKPKENLRQPSSDELELKVKALEGRVTELNDFIENASLPLHRVDANGIVIWANQAELDALGYTREEYIGQPISKFHADEHIITDILARLTNNEILLNYEARLVRKDGAIRHVLINSSVYREDDRFIHTRCFTRDITDRKLAEERIRQNEQQLRLITASIPALIAYVGSDLRYRFVNHAYEKWFGRPHTEMIGKSVRDVLGEELHAIARPHIEKALAGDEVAFEAYAPHCSGVRRHVTVNYIPDRSPAGEVLGYVTLIQDISDQKRIEQELAAALTREEAAHRSAELERRHLHSLFMQAPMPIAILEGPEHRFTLQNAAYSGLVGGRDLIGKPIRLALPELAGQPFYDLLDQVYRTGVPYQGSEMPARLLQANGELKESIFNFVYEPWRDLDGKAKGILIVATDVTQEVFARKAVEESESRFRQVANTIPQIVWTADPSGAATYFNDVWFEYSGWTFEQTKDWGWKPLIHPEDRERAVAAFIAAVDAGIAFESEHRFIRATDKTWRWHLVRARPIRDAHGKISMWVGTATDIDDQKRAQEKLLGVQAELQRQKEVLEAIHRVGQAIAAELDRDKLVQLVTDAATQLSGAQFGAFFYNVVNEQGEAYTLYTVSGAPREAFSQFPMPRKTQVFEPTFMGSGIVRSDDITQDPRYGKNAPYRGMPSGHLPVVSYLAVPVMSRAGEVLGGLFFGHPSTGRFTQREETIVAGLAAQAAIAIDNAQLYRRAREAVLARDEFLSIASHELKTPLTSLTLQLQMLTRSIKPEEGIVPSPEKLAKTAAMSLQQAERLRRLTDDLLDVSRIQARRLMLALSHFNLSQLVAETVERFGEEFARAECTLSLTLSEEVVGTWDRSRIEQALVNLVSNALKYAPGTPIGIAVMRINDRAQLVVQDAGPGIPLTRQSRIFERFERAGSRNVSGLGLGLFIVKEIIEAHQGTIAVVSEEGGGAKFVVTLPMRTQNKS